MFNKIKLFLPLIFKLGVQNSLYVFWYKVSLKLGIRKRFFPIGKSISGPFFKESKIISNYPQDWQVLLFNKVENLEKGRFKFFHFHQFQNNIPPNWFLNPFNQSSVKNPKKHWTELGDFDLGIGDIKTIWELSRFDWLNDFCRAYKVSGEIKYLNIINDWLANWSENNPKNQGPNWKCGQETSIRVMKLISCSEILEQENDALPSLQNLIYDHLERINGNIYYAIAQDNNHGTSEAAALYIGSLWLTKQNNTGNFAKKKLIKWKNKGRELLEGRILKLISNQGTFAQKSVNYHRVVIDTMSWVLFLMNKYNETSFSNLILIRLQSLGEWQYKMISSSKGEVPNLGSNDGAMFETLHSCDYSDFRPSTQLFFAMLNGYRVFNEGTYDEVLFWRNQNYLKEYPLKSINLPIAEILDEQYFIISNKLIKLFLILPNDKFRPGSCDAFHLDLWVNDENQLLDSGSFSYNAGEKTALYKSVAAHNTIQFGSQEQMPKLSRFLYGNWIKIDANPKLSITENEIEFEASYTDYCDNKHKRNIRYLIKENKIIVLDEVSSTIKNKTLRWNTNSNNLALNVIFNNIRIEPIIKKSFKSNYYLEESSKNILIYSFDSNAIQTIINI